MKADSRTLVPSVCAQEHAVGMVWHMDATSETSLNANGKHHARSITVEVLVRRVGVLLKMWEGLLC